MTARHTSTTSPITLHDQHGTLSVARDDTGALTLVDLRLGRHGTTAHGLADADLLLARSAAAPAIPAQRPAGNAAARPPHAPALHAALTAPLTAAPAAR